MANLVPDNIVCATRLDGADADAVRHWLESGGDPNWNLVDPNSHGIPRTYRLLMLATEHQLCDIMRILISHGADVNYKYTMWEEESEDDDYAWKPLDLAFYKRNAEAALLLLDNGANASQLNLDAWEEVLEDHSHRLLRIVLAAGADFTACSLPGGFHGKTPEAFARNAAATIYDADCAAIYEESVSILEGVRLAGSYKQYILRDFKELLRTRSLLARGRAFMGPKTPEVVARLFGGSTARTRPQTRRHRPLERAAGVPDPAFWLVMEYWRLGDWRRGAGPEWEYCPEIGRREMC